MTSPTVRFEHVEQRVDVALEERPHAFDRTRGERTGDQLAKARVVGRVDERQHVGERLQCRTVVVARVATHAGVGSAALAEVRGAEHCGRRLVGGGVPEAVGHAVQGRRVAQPRVERVRVVGIRRSHERLHDVVEFAHGPPGLSNAVAA